MSVDAQHVVPHLDAQIDAARLGQHACVIDQNVDAAELLDACIDTGLRAFDRADVSHAGVHLRAKLAALLGDLGQVGRITVAQHQPCAFNGVGPRDSSPYAAACAGDHGTFVFELLHSELLVTDSRENP